MSEQRDPFFPHRVDESIEQLASTGQSDNAFRGQTHIDPDARLVHDLQKLYGLERKRYLQALQRVEDRLVEQHITQSERPAVFPVPSLQQRRRFDIWKIRQGRLDSMDNKQSSTPGMAKFGGRVALLVAALVLVGSLLVVLNYARQRTTATGSTTTRPTPTMSVKTKGTPTSTPTLSGSLGKTLYTTPPNSFGFSALSWSPDSKRVASATDGVQIWDASTGKHLVTVQMPAGGEWPYGLDWSPNSQQVAVATNQHVLVVNGQTGQIVRTYAANTVAMTNTAPSGTSYLASLFPGSGGLGFRATAWSPDGHLMASALSFGPTGEVQVWHPQTGALAFNLKVSNPSYNIGALSWSSDGQYIAAITWNTQGGNPNQPNSMVVVWKVSTHQIVFQHNDFMDSGASIVWLPQGYNLAFDGATSSGGGNLVATLEIWNATTGKLVKQYIGAGNGGLTWSPNGKYLAYAGYGGKNAENAVIILDVTTGKQVYIYKGHHNHISVIDWSPDGRYIVSGEGNTQGNMVAKVWVAE